MKKIIIGSFMLKKTALFFLFIISSVFDLYSFKVYVNSIPKCGTHLLTKCIEFLIRERPFQPSTETIFSKIDMPFDKKFFNSHLPYSQKIENKIKKEKYKAFFIYRDPRDQIISNAYWIMKDPTHYLPEDKPAEILSNDINQLINFFIKDIDEVYLRYLPWLKNPEICSIKYEELVGIEGGGSSEKQKAVIKKICSHLNLNNIKLNDTINYCVKNLYGGTGTFRNGKIGVWKKYFTEQQKTEFKKIAGNILIELGYEKNMNW